MQVTVATANQISNLPVHSQYHSRKWPRMAQPKDKVTLPNYTHGSCTLGTISSPLFLPCYPGRHLQQWQGSISPRRHICPSGRFLPRGRSTSMDRYPHLVIFHSCAAMLPNSTHTMIQAAHEEDGKDSSLARVGYCLALLGRRIRLIPKKYAPENGRSK